MLERWNTHFSTTVEQELFGCAGVSGTKGRQPLGRRVLPPACCTRHAAVPSLRCWSMAANLTASSTIRRIDFQLAQDPNSSNLGTTVWDASIVLAKYIEKARRLYMLNAWRCGVRAAGGGIICSSMHAIAASPLRLPRGCGATSHHCIPCVFSSACIRPAIGLQNSRRGDFSRPKIRGKRALELGAGMGLAGMALALLGAGRPSLNRRFIYVAACQQAPRWPDMPMSCRCSAQPRCHTHPSAGHPALFLAHCADVTFTDIGDVLPSIHSGVYTQLPHVSSLAQMSRSRTLATCCRCCAATWSKTSRPRRLSVSRACGLRRCAL